MTSCTVLWRDVDYHRQLQKQVSYETRMKSNTAFSKKNARQSLGAVIKREHEDKKRGRHQESINKIYEKIKQRKIKN